MHTFPIDNDFRPWYKIDKPATGRRLIVTDLHGSLYTFQELLRQIKLTPADQLFILGDMIDRGKRGKEVLDLILSLIDGGFGVFPLRGNHEDMLLKSHEREPDNCRLPLPPVLNRTSGIRNENRKIHAPYLRLIAKLPYYYELDCCYLVHGGFNFDSPSPFTDYDSMLWINHFDVSPNKTNNKIVIHGHTKQKLPDIQQAIARRSTNIGLDNACYSTKRPDYGHMLCFNPDTYELFVQPNVEADTNKHQSFVG